MRRDYLTIVAGMSLLSGVITGVIIYAGGLFAAPRVVAATAPAPTLPPPEVITVLAPTATAAPVPTPAPTAGPVLRAPQPLLASLGGTLVHRHKLGERRMHIHADRWARPRALELFRGMGNGLPGTIRAWHEDEDSGVRNRHLELY